MPGPIRPITDRTWSTTRKQGMTTAIRGAPAATAVRKISLESIFMRSGRALEREGRAPRSRRALLRLGATAPDGDPEQGREDGHPPRRQEIALLRDDRLDV